MRPGRHRQLECAPFKDVGSGPQAAPNFEQALHSLEEAARLNGYNCLLAFEDRDRLPKHWKTESCSTDVALRLAKSISGLATQENPSCTNLKNERSDSIDMNSLQRADNDHFQETFLQWKKHDKEGTLKKLHEWYDEVFHALHQVVCKRVAQAWIAAIHPKKTSECQYKENQTNGPYWWPKGVRHIGPHHLLEKERIDLLMHILVNLHGQKTSEGRLINAQLLHEATLRFKNQIEAEKPIGQKAFSMLKRLHEVQALEEQFKNESVHLGNHLRTSLPHYPRPVRGAQGKRKQNNATIQVAKRCKIESRTSSTTSDTSDSPILKQEASPQITIESSANLERINPRNQFKPVVWNQSASTHLATPSPTEYDTRPAAMSSFVPSMLNRQQGQIFPKFTPSQDDYTLAYSQLRNLHYATKQNPSQHMFQSDMKNPMQSPAAGLQPSVSQHPLLRSQVYNDFSAFPNGFEDPFWAVGAASLLSYGIPYSGGDNQFSTY